ncbi:TauD/TfdA family dioxygenase [Sphingomonas sp. LB2R24]|uniref:TauD/TfdA family dioxygenase n=1 Tax=Sphingomonas sorbitolis TaxID=3096165 RepID=UPI002FC75483
MAADGYAILAGLAPGLRSDHVAEKLGETIAPWGGDVVQSLMPKTTSTPNTYSGIFGVGQFPFHTDLAHWSVPPRYLLLRCVRGYADVPTLMLDGRAIGAIMGNEALGRALARPRRPQHGELRLLRLRQTVGPDEIIRWDSVYLTPASRVGVLAFETFQSLIHEAKPQPAVMVNDGDVLVIDNWRMLHARPAIPPDRRDRKLERVYLRNLL